MEWMERLKSGWNLSVNNFVIKIKHKTVFNKIVCYEILFHKKSVETILNFGDIQ